MSTRSSGIPFGNYRLLKRIARGGMAEVFLARQGGLEGFDRLVAVKRILPHLVDSSSFVRMFLDEARLAARLSHANIVHIYEFGKVEEHYFIAMEYVEGIHAGTLIKSKDRLPLALVARIGADACAGLHYAHELPDADGRPLKIVHRDISPPNLIVSFDGVVKLVDFGIAKAVSQVEHTKPGVVKGKFAYMSPEQTTGDPLDGRSDVFSLGLVLWELLAGKVALSRADPVAAMTQIRDGKLPPIESVRPDVPAALAAAIGGALAVKPSERATALDLGLALEALIKSFPEPGTTLGLAAWLRERFPRPTTGAQLAIGASRPATRGATVPGTRAGTAPPTAQGTAATGPQLETPRAATEPHLDTAAFLAKAPPLTGGDRAPDTDPVRTATDPVRAATSISSSHSPPDPGEATAIMTRVSHREHERARGRKRRIALICGVTLAASGAAAFALTRAGSVTSNKAPRPQVVNTATPPPDSMDAAPAKPVAEPVFQPAVVPRAVDAGPALASLTVVTMPPGATITVGGQEPQASPVILDDLSPGRYEVTATLEGHRSQTVAVNLGDGEVRTLQLALTAKPEPQKPRDRRADRRSRRERKEQRERTERRETPARPGLLNVRTTPYSIVYLGGRKLGVTPFAGVELPPGTYTLTFKHPGRDRVKRRVRIRSGKTTKLSFSL